MAKYTISIDTHALKSLKKLPTKVQVQIQEKIDGLAEQPRPAGCKKLKGEDLYRVRAGDYRVIYQIEDKILYIAVVKIGHRKDIYENR